MKPKPSAIYRRFSSGPPQLIVPETTDGNCECKHVNSAGVAAKKGAPRFVPPWPGRTVETRASRQENNHFVSGVKVLRRLTHRRINTHVNTHIKNPTQVSRLETEAGNNDSISNIKKVQITSFRSTSSDPPPPANAATCERVGVCPGKITLISIDLNCGQAIYTFT